MRTSGFAILPTIRPASNGLSVKTRVFLLLATALMAACETLPRDAFRPSASALAVRNLQTREYESVSEKAILAASTAVLQDMGYAIDEIEEPLGVLSASKRADAANALEFFGAVIVDGVKCVFTFTLGCDGKNYGEIGDVQDIRMTLISRPALENENNAVVRITIQRIVWDKKGRISHQESITDTDVYASLFEKMSKAVFLEQQGL